ncbi:MAG: hypothetical protein Q9M28_02770 [Mariprofundaceae bacterium]|nr:hypothetical protein [Mariprofundaceae bacterium]
MMQKHSSQQYQAWLEQLNRTNSVVSCMVVDGYCEKIVASAGVDLDEGLTGLIHKFYAELSLSDSGEQLISSEKYYHLTRFLDKENKTFVHVVVKKNQVFLPLVRLKVSNLVMNFSFSTMMLRNMPAVHALSLAPSL